MGIDFEPERTTGFIDLELLISSIEPEAVLAVLFTSWTGCGFSIGGASLEVEPNASVRHAMLTATNASELAATATFNKVLGFFIGDSAIQALAIVAMFAKRGATVW